MPRRAASVETMDMMRRELTLRAFLKRTSTGLFLLAWLVSAPARSDGPATDFEKNWPQWRGPHANGVAPYGDPPVHWGENENVRWKIEIPGSGHATPIVWDDRVFVLTAVEMDKRAKPGGQDPGSSPPGGGPRTTTTTSKLDFSILAIRRADGQVLWQRSARQEVPHEGMHTTASWASSSPVTDGKHVYAYFGSRGLYCYDMQGKLEWSKDLGDMHTRRGFGEGSSPALYGEHIVVNWDHEGQSFIVVLDKHTGKKLWKVERDEPTSWSTPLVVAGGGKPQVITSAANRVRAYDLATGKLVWHSNGMTLNVVPSPVVADDLVYVMSGFRGSALQAIRLSVAKGDITGTEAIAWTYDQDTSYVPSPLLYDDTLCFLKTNDGILTCLDPTTGGEHFARQRLPDLGQVFASPVGAGGRVYIPGGNGATVVVKRGPKYKLLAENRLDDSFSASPALAGREIYLRGADHLYCLARDGAED
jgi:outer membrane protein assembly factor BamB